MISATSDNNPIIQPPSDLLTPQKDPNTGQDTYAFPLQTTAWLKMQTVVTTALGFPLSQDDFTRLYGSFSDEATVEQAVTILGSIRQTANQYGDPTTLISQLAAFQQANTPPESIYGHAVWLAAQTQLAAQQIASLLNVGLTEIGKITDASQRLQDLTELLTGQGGIDSYATTLQSYIGDFQKQTGAFYDTLNTELNGPTNSLATYLNQSDNVLSDAQNIVASDKQQIDTLTSDIDKLNKEYIGFTTAASVSPLFLGIPFIGVFVAVADAATFGVLAAKVKGEISDLEKQLSNTEQDYQQKSLLVSTLTSFNASVSDVSVDGKDFLDAISQLSSGWTEFSSQINLRLQSLTPDDLADWSAFLQQINFNAALDGWNLIASKAEEFFQAGFVRFSTQSSAS